MDNVVFLYDCGNHTIRITMVDDGGSFEDLSDRAYARALAYAQKRGWDPHDVVDAGLA